MPLSRTPQALARKRLVALTAALTVGLAGSGCESMSHTERGALTGAGIGAVGGGLLGSLSGKAGAGAAIGAVAGTAAGALTGAAVDNAEHKAQVRAATAAAEARRLGLTDVVQMTQQGVADNLIVGQIRSTGSVFQLSAQDVIWLRNNRVSDPVIGEMQRTAYQTPRRVYSPAPMVQPVYIVEPLPPPPPPVAVGVGFTYRGRCR